ncbi:MAG: GntR family transcriptional regulator [Pseudoclavibacter sp.]|nr:GntR family transcriptional regulator [Pseudoclavibacter sp.]
MNDGAADGRRDEHSAAAGLLLRPERRANAFEETVRRLLQSIRLGLVQPGTRLPPERELAGMTGVGRDTVREAIAALSEAGYLVARRGRYGGTFVVDRLPAPQPLVIGEDGLEPGPEATPEHIRDVLLTRRVVELGIVRAAAEAELSGQDRDRLWQTHEACARAAPDDYRRLDARLHILFAELTASPTLLELAADARMRVNGLLDRIPVLAPNLTHSTEQHEAIVRAILLGRPDEAQERMSEHLEGSEALLRGFLD